MTFQALLEEQDGQAVEPEETLTMKKIPTIFVRDWNTNPKYVTREPNPECAWVFAGEGKPTRKYDGTCVRFDGQRWWARREVKKGKQPPPNFVQVEHDDETAKTVGWEPVEQSGFAKWHAEAIREADQPEGDRLLPGTYELIGPKINGNPEGEEFHVLRKHEFAEECFVPVLTYEGIRDQVRALAATDGCEGVVFHHPDGRMAKIKARDFA